MKKKLICLLMGVLMISLVGCQGARAGDEPIYSSDEKFDIGMWVGAPNLKYTYDEDGNKINSEPITDAEFLRIYQDIADSGINIAFPGYETMHDGTGIVAGSADSYNVRVLKAAKAVGIKHIIAIGEMKSYLMNCKTLIEAGTLTEDAAVAHVKGLIDPYRQYGSLYGFMIQDEPNATYFDALGYGEKIFKKAAPDLMFYVNLFPVIATGDQLGGGSAIRYDAYINQYLNKIDTDYLSYDHYPLYAKGDDTVLEKTFIYNMDLLKRRLIEDGKDRKFWTFLQSIPYNKNRALTSAADAKFQSNTFLAYGGDGIQWFCYACPPPYDGATRFGEGMIDRNLEKTDTYTYVQTANKEIQAMMPYYKNFDWQGIMLSNVNGGEGNFEFVEGNVLTSNKTLKSITSTDDVLVGVFKDKDDRQGFMVVNFTDPFDKIKNDVTLTLSGAKKAIVIKDSVKVIMDVKNNKLTFKMDEGAGYFVIPY